METYSENGGRAGVARRHGFPDTSAMRGHMGRGITYRAAHGDVFRR